MKLFLIYFIISGIFIQKLVAHKGSDADVFVYRSVASFLIAWIIIPFMFVKGFIKCLTEDNKCN